MAEYYSDAVTKHTLAFIAPRSRPSLVQAGFEVLGNVHGLNYSKYAKEMCQKLNVHGWMRYNNKRGSIVGELEGEKDKVDQMIMWLRMQGAPGSRISQCIIRNWHIVDTSSFKDFRIRF